MPKQQIKTRSRYIISKKSSKKIYIHGIKQEVKLTLLAQNYFIMSLLCVNFDYNVSFFIRLGNEYLFLDTIRIKYI